jgi:hypothetical protein
MDGTITAGIYHELNIVIPNDHSDTSQMGGFSKTLQINQGDNAPYVPFAKSYNPNFDAQSFIGTHFDPTDAILLKSGTSSTPVGAYTLGTLYASGGSVTVNAGTLTGAGTITAYGGPSITVTNNSPDYLVLGAVNIPNIPGGQVNFTGAAGLSSDKSLVINQIGATASPSVIINQAYNGSVGSNGGNYGPALFLTGPITNLGGVVSITNVSGSLGQAATVYGQQVNISVPQGVTIVTIAPPGVYYAGGNPYSEWQNYMLWPGGNPTQGVPNASLAASFVANAEHPGFTTASALTQAIIGTAGSVWPANQSTVYFGDAVPYALGDDSSGTASTLTGIASGGALSGNYRLGSGGASNNNGYFPLIPVEPLSTSATSYTSADLTGSTASSAIYGKQVSINAQTLDINGDITAGQPTNWSLDLPASLTTPFTGALWLDQMDYQLGLHGPIFDIPVSTLAPGDSQITATYNAETNQITVDNVSASSGGGAIRLKGGIISSNQLGHIHINGGLGQVHVNNHTGIPLVLQQIYAGSDSQAGSVASTVDITDTNQPAATRQTLYVYQPGQPIAVYKGAAGATLGTGTPSSTITGTSATYNPTAGLRWQWVEKATLGRTITYDRTVGAGSWSVSNWAWTSGTPTNPWEYVDPNTSQATGSTPPVGQQITDTSLENTAFTESITGSSHIGFHWVVQYHHDSNGNTNFGFANADGPDDPNYDPNDTVYHSFSGGSDWYYYYPDSATLTLTSSVKADNPITVDFAGLSVGDVTITSDAQVILDDTITNPNGDTTITAREGIKGSNTSIVSHNLTLSATDGAIDLGGSLTTGGVLNVTGSSQGVHLRLNSGALIGQVSAGTAGGGYGDVVLSATGDLEAAPASPGSVTGTNITLTSSAGGVGSQSAPLHVSTNGTKLANGGFLAGTLNVSALHDIGLQQDLGDLSVGSITSTAGDVFVNVINGGLFDSRGETPASVLSDAQIQQVWSNLHLLDPSYATRANPSVASFQNQVNVNYLQYWELLDNGTVQNGTYALDSTGAAGAAALQLFRPRTAAALGVANPTDQQIEDYAAGVYQATVKFFDINLNSLYWQLLANGTVQGGTLVLNASAIATFRSQAAAALGIPNPTDAQVQGWADSRYQAILADQNPDRSWMGLADFTTFNPQYQYAATTDQVTALTQNSQWTEPVLRYAVSATGLAAGSGTTVGTTTPNIAGRNVTLQASGGIGRLAPPVDVSLDALRQGPPTLTDDQIAALAVATAPGSVLLNGTVGGNPVTVPFGKQPAGFVLTGIHLIQTAPLFVAASGNFKAIAGKSVFVQSTAQDLTIDQVQAKGGDANLTAPGSIRGAGMSSPQITTSGNLTLLAGTGNLGTAPAAPLVVSIGGVLDAATAGDNIYLQQTHKDLNFNRISAGGAVQLTDLDGGLYQRIANLPLVATSFTFNVRDAVNEPAGVGGSGIAPLLIQLSGPATLAGQAGQSININNVGTPTQGALTLAGPTSIDGVSITGLTSTNGDVTLQSALSILDGIDRSQGAQSADVTGNNITLTTGGTAGSTIGTAAANLYIDSAYSHPGMLTATTNQNAYLVETNGDLTLNQVNARFGSAYLAAPSGSIVNGNAGQTSPPPNIIAVKTYLAASGSVGPLNTQVSYLEGRAGSAASNSFTVSNTGPAVVGGVTTNPTAVQAGGAVTVTTHSPLTVTSNVIANQDVHLSGNDDAGEDDDLIVQAGVTIQSAGVFQNGILQSGGNVFIQGGDGVTLQAGSTVLAAKKVTIQDDFTQGGGTDPEGTDDPLTIAVYGTINAPQTEIDGSPAGDTFNLQGTLYGNVSVQGGAGNDTILVNPASILGTLSVNAGGGSSNRLIVNDSGNTTTPRSVTVTSGSITGFGPGTISYSASGGSFNDGNSNDGILITSSATQPTTFNVQSTLAGSTTLIRSGGAVDTYNVGSTTPAAGGKVDNIQGTLTVAGSGGDTLNVDDTGSTGQKSGTLTPTTLTGLNMGSAGITYGGLSTLSVHLGSGGSTIPGSPVGNTFTIKDINPLTHTSVDGGVSGNDTVNVTTAADFNGRLDLTAFEHGTVTVNGNLNGTLTDTLPGHLETVKVTGSVASTGSLLAGSIDSMTVGTDLAGAVTTQQALTNLTVGRDVSGSVTESGTIQNLSIGRSLTSTGTVTASGNLNTLTVGQDLAGAVAVSGTLTTANVTGNLSGSVTESGTINQLSVGGSLTSTGVVKAINPTATLGNINTLTVGTDLAGTVQASGTITTLTTGGNLSGSVSESGTINLVQIGGSLTPTGSISAVNTSNPSVGTINTLTIGQDLAGAVTVSGTIHHLNIVNGSIKPTASLTLGNLDSLVIGPNHLSVGQNFAGTLTVTGNLGSLQVAGGIPGWIRAGHIGTIAAYGGYGPVVLRVTENGIERRVEAAVPGTPYPLPNNAAVATAPYVNVQYIYEGTLPGSSGTLANPQLTARITNNVGTGRDQYDLSLVTYNDTAKFNLARLDATGVSGVRNVDVEGDVLKTVSSQASNFFPGDTTPAGIRLPLDNLAGVGIRDFAPNASIQAASIQELAFGSHATATGQIVTGAASVGSDAQALLVSGTAMVYANDTYRAPFADLGTQQVQEFFVTSPSGGSFNSNGILLAVQSITSPNAAGTANVVTPSNVARGAATALVTLVPTYNSRGQLQSPVVQTIALRGDGGSIATQQPFSATASITSTGPLGDLTISSAQGINNVTAPSMFGSITTVGPITGLVQTTGQRTDPITSVVTTVAADLGRLYVNTSGAAPVVTSTTVTANGLSGELVSRGDLISQITLNSGPLSGVIAAQGNLGKVFTPSSGPATRLGGVLVSPTSVSFSGDVVVLGLIDGDMRFNGGLRSGRIAAKGGIVGNLTINGGLDSSSSVVSGGEIGDTTWGTQFTFGGTNAGILAAEGTMHFARSSPGGEVFNNAIGANKAAIDAIFTNYGQSLEFDLTPSGLDLGGLNLILPDLAALYVNSNGNLAGTTP